jgi:hypothetical protein
LVHVDLRGGQTDTIGFVHRRQHVVDQRTNSRIDSDDRFGHRVQTRIGIAQDRQQTHGS